MTAIVPETRIGTFQVSAVGTNETQAIFTVKKGDVILWMYAVLVTKLGSGTTETTTIGDGDDVDGYGDNGDMDAEGTVGNIIPLAKEGIAVINIDDPYAELWLGLAGDREIVTFGIDNGAATIRAVPQDIRVSVSNAAITTQFILHTPDGFSEVSLKLAGRHNVMNALAASATAFAAGVGIDEIVNGLALIEPIDGRFKVKSTPGGVRVIDDTYPEALTS